MVFIFSFFCFIVLVYLVFSLLARRSSSSSILSLPFNRRVSALLTSHLAIYEFVSTVLLAPSDQRRVTLRDRVVIRVRLGAFTRFALCFSFPRGVLEHLLVAVEIFRVLVRRVAKRALA